MLALSTLLLDVLVAAGAAQAAGQPPSPALRIFDDRRSPVAVPAQAGLAARALDAGGPEYAALAIEPPSGYTRSRAYGVNDLGQVAGRVSNWNETTQKAFDRTPFVWDPVDGIELLPGLGGEGGVWGLNNEGQASGWSYLSTDPAAFERGARWDTSVSPATVTDIGTLANADEVNGDNSMAYDLNDDGAVTGYAEIPINAGYGFTPYHGILYTDAGGLQDLGTFVTSYPEYANGYGISYSANAAGQVVGLANALDGGWIFRPFIWDAAGGLRQLQIDAAYRYNEWYAVAINDSGRIGGHVIAATDHSLPYYWTGESAAPIAVAMPTEFPYAEIYGINASGVMVGLMWNDAGEEHAFVFDTVNGVRDLNDLIDPTAGWVLQYARDINASGQIVGTGTKDGDERGFILTPYQLLTIVVDGTGSAAGTVDAAPSGGGGPSIQCTYPGTAPGPVTCTGWYPLGTVVELDATPGIGSEFAGWSDDCSGTGGCSVTMNGPRTVGATFGVLKVLTVSKSGLGIGTVTSSPAGINCGSTCSAGFATGTEVTLSATPGANSVFAGWSGACSGTGPCVVTMSAAASVGARFNLGGTCVVTVSNQTVSGAASHEACYAILAGPALSVVAPGGNLSLRANTLVVLRNGVSVGPGARLTIALGGVAPPP